MNKILLLSDTHSHWNDEWNKYIESADEIWHAGDIGNENVLIKIKEIAKDKTLRAVYGNIDGHTIRIQTKEYLSFQIEGLNILIIHIAGSFGKYNQKTKELISVYRPNILVCGHSHILKIKWDEKYQLWYINPGAAGIYGFHKVSTALFFELNDKRIQNLKVIEWKKTSKE
jgi:putative phosphoesterase